MVTLMTKDPQTEPNIIPHGKFIGSGVEEQTKLAA